MFSRSYHVATAYRFVALASSVLLGACALRGADRPIVSAIPERTSASSVREGYLVDTPEFALVTSSAPVKTIALESLHGSASAFQWLFGDPAPHIGVLVVDGRTMSAPAASGMMPGDLTTIMLMTGEPDPLAPTKSAAELSSALRTMSADAWLHDYASLWTASLNDDDASHGVQPVENPARAEALPHWLRAGSLRLIAEGSASSAIDMSLRTPMPLRSLFSYDLRPAEIGVVGRMLHHPDWLAVADSADSTDETIARSFIIQSASVLRYLRETQGDSATADLFGASMLGIPADEILPQLPRPTSIAELERGWLSWVSEGGRVATATVTR